MIHSNHQPGVICKNTENDHVDFDWPNPTCAGALQRKQEMDMDRRAHLGPQPRRWRGQAVVQTRMTAWRWVSSTSASPKPALPGPGGKAQPTSSPREELHIHRPASGVRGAGFPLPDPTRMGLSRARWSCSCSTRTPGGARERAANADPETAAETRPRGRARKGPQARCANGGLLSLSRGEESTSTNWSRTSSLGSRPNSLRPPAKNGF